MAFVMHFKELSSKDVDSAGGKGASLGEMTQAGIPVPPGFVVLAGAFDHFIEETEIKSEIISELDKVNHQDVNSVEQCSEKIQSAIKSQPMPKEIGNEIIKAFGKLNSKFVAVRSSATAEDSSAAACAGQLDSFLNTPKSKLLEKIQHCWASLFTPRAIFYRFEQNLDKQHISVAVVVQKMVESDDSGIGFSVHPVTQDRNQLIIESGFGLGEAIVSGQITPDSYVVQKDDWKIIECNVSEQSRGIFRKGSEGNEWKELGENGKEQVLTEKEILELSRLLVKIEKHYGFPVDIEWAREGKEFYIVQSRPITTLSSESAPAEKKKRFELTYKKIYTRDFSIIMEEAWYYANHDGLKKKYNINTFSNPTYIYYTNDGTVEVWENTAAIKHLNGEILKCYKNNKNFLYPIIKKYNKEIKTICKYWKSPPKTIPQLKKFTNLVFDIMVEFVIIYQATTDKRVPEHARKSALKWREKDIFFDSCDKALRVSLNNIYPDRKHIVTILHKEINNPPSASTLKKRFTNFILIPGKLSQITTLKEFAEKNPEYTINFGKITSSKTIKGQVAVKGKARGVVRIIKRKDQLGVVSKGDIIVSPMTTPDFAPAMKKASAIITDEGGLTCHAAIVSREMKKPCIIGTKIATQVLKDGDLVEVDAEKGVVKIK